MSASTLGGAPWRRLESTSFAACPSERKLGLALPRSVAQRALSSGGHQAGHSSSLPLSSKSFSGRATQVREALALPGAKRKK